MPVLMLAMWTLAQAVILVEMKKTLTRAFHLMLVLKLPPLRLNQIKATEVGVG